MQTFKIFFNYFGTWMSVKDGDGFDIEFLSLAAAKSIAKDLSLVDRYWYLYPVMSREDWYICDSNGMHHNI